MRSMRLYHCVWEQNENNRLTKSWYVNQIIVGNLKVLIKETHSLNCIILYLIEWKRKKIHRLNYDIMLWVAQMKLSWKSHIWKGIYIETDLKTTDSSIVIESNASSTLSYLFVCFWYRFCSLTIFINDKIRTILGSHQRWEKQWNGHSRSNL